tara:strand:- start:248 stop:700 length:453 start_codon:yes stop_codon:yes gene_type:complete
MQDLRTKLILETKQAMRDRNKTRLGTLRMISSEFKRFEVDQRQTPVESDLISILEKMLKQRKDSLDQFRKAERNDLADLELAEIAVIEEFLPAKFSDSELTELIAKLIEKLNLNSPSEMGAAMKELKSSGDPRIDMGKASQIVKELLATK